MGIIIPLHTYIEETEFNVWCRGFVMQEYELKILEKYPINVRSTRKTRGAFFCETEQGLFLLKEAGISDRRIPALYKLGELLEQEGNLRVDQIFPNSEGEYVSVSEDGIRYLLKHWYYGRECEIRRNRELFEGVKQLARLHLLMNQPFQEYTAQEMHLKDIYESHNRELRKVRKFVRGRTAKGEFEMQFLKEFDALYEWADAAVKALDESGYSELYDESIRRGCMVHGEYNYHNILMTPEGIAVTNFEKFRRGVQMEDLYYFLRKAMEKHRWNVQLCDCMLNAYSAVRPVSEAELEYLKIRMIYPEKFWKITGSYYRSNKAWISVKNVEKFQTAVMQTQEKRRLLEEIFGFHL